MRELRAFAQVNSPYLVRVYDAVLQDSFLYAMEYCPLGSLAAPARPLSRGEVLRAVAHVGCCPQTLSVSTPRRRESLVLPSLVSVPYFA